MDEVLKPQFRAISPAIVPERLQDRLDTIRTYVMSVNPTLGEQQLDEIVGQFWPVTPEPGSVADRLLKEREQCGVQRGEERGGKRGLAWAIQAFQKALGVAVSGEAELLAKTVEDLKAELVSLQLQVTSRPTEL